MRARLFPLFAIAFAAATVASATGPTIASFGAPRVIPGFHPEPSLLVAPGDQLIVAAPAGLDIQNPFFDDGRSLVWRDDGAGGAFTELSPPPFLIGGGDTDILIAPDGTLFAVDLSLASITSWSSPDLGDSWSDPFPLASGTLANDRMWLAADDQGAVYLSYNQLETGYWVAKSTDGGALWIPTHAAGVGQYPPGPLIFTSDGVLAFAHSTGPAGSIAGLLIGDTDVGVPAAHAGFAMWITTSKDHGATWNDHMITTLPEWGQNLFPALTSDSEGNLYAVWAEGIISAHNPIKYAVSMDGGDSWSAPRTLVDAGAGCNMLPWAVATTPGHLGVVYLRTDGANTNAAAHWRVEYAQTLDALSPTPTVTTSLVHDDAFVGSVSGLSARPPIGDFLTVRTLSDGRAAVAYAVQDSGGDAVQVVVQTGGTTL